MSTSRAAAESSATVERRTPPGPRGRFLLGSLPEFARDILGFMTQCVREHGDFVHVHLPAREVFLLNRPQDIEAVLLTQRTNFNSRQRRAALGVHPGLDARRWQ